MARIAQAELGAVAPKALPTPYDATRVTPESQGAGLGEGLQSLAGGAANVGKALEDMDELRARQALAAYHADTNEALAKFRTLQGDNAIGGMSQLEKELEDKRKARGEPLSARQRELFMREADLRGRVTVAEGQGHLSAQRRVVAGSIFNAELSETLKSIANSYDDDAAVARQIALVRPNIAAHAREQGLPAAELERQFAEKVASTRLDMMLAKKQTAAAQDYLARVSGTLPADKLDNYTKTLSGMADAQKADVVAQQFVRQSLGPDGQVNRRKMQGLIDKADATLRDRVQHYADHRADVYDKAWRDEATNLAGIVASEGIDPATGRFTLALVDGTKRWQDLERIWPAKAAELRKAGRLGSVAEQKELAAQKAEQLFGPEAVGRTALMSQAEFSAEIAGLDPKTKTHFLGQFARLKKNADSYTPPETIVIEESAKALNLGNPKKKIVIGALPPEKQQAFSDLMEAVRGRARDWAAKHSGAPPDKDEVRKMVAAELQVVRDGGWFSPDVRKFQADREIPAVDRKQIEDALKASGKKPTEDLVRDRYRRMRERKRIGPNVTLATPLPDLP